MRCSQGLSQAGASLVDHVESLLQLHIAPCHLSGAHPEGLEVALRPAHPPGIVLHREHPELEPSGECPHTHTQPGGGEAAWGRQAICWGGVRTVLTSTD